jgi:hypothetical protein
VGVAAFNLLAYAEAAGVWNALRMVWVVALVLWGSLNLFYWPFWLAQDDKSMWNTYANCGRFFAAEYLANAAFAAGVCGAYRAQRGGDAAVYNGADGVAGAAGGNGRTSLAHLAIMTESSRFTIILTSATPFRPV